MTKIFLIILAVLLVLTLIFYFLWRTAKAKQKETQNKLENTSKELSRAIAEQAKLESTIQIMEKNRGNTDEKINNLHTGNTTDNAINELHDLN